MKRSSLLITLTGVLVFALGSGNIIKAGDIYLDGVRNIASADKRDYFLTIIQVAEIVDEDLYEQLRSMNPVTDSSSIAEIFENWKREMDYRYNPETPYKNEYDSVLQERIQHCDDTGYRYYWPSGIWEWDERAVLVLKYGPPDIERWLGVFDCYPSPNTNCVRYLMEWYAPYREFVLQDRKPGRHPSSVIPVAHEVEIAGDATHYAARKSREIIEEVYIAQPHYIPHPETEKIIKSRVRDLIFPDHNDNYSVWIASMTRGDQFSRNGDSTFSCELVIYDSLHEPVYQEVSQPHNLAVLSGIKAKEIWYPDCLGGVILPAGYYEAVLLIREHDTKNLGKYLLQFTLPSDRASDGMSDIMLYSQSKPTSNSKLIRRNGSLFVPYLLGLTPGEEFKFYIEIEPIPVSERYEWTLSGTLHPVNEDAKEIIDISPAQKYWDEFGREDTLAGEKLRKEYEKWEKKRAKKNSKTPVYFVYSFYESTDSPIRKLTGLARLPDDLPKGNYSFVLEINELHTSTNCMAYYRLEVR